MVLTSNTFNAPSLTFVIQKTYTAIGEKKQKSLFRTQVWIDTVQTNSDFEKLPQTGPN